MFMGTHVTRLDLESTNPAHKKNEFHNDNIDDSVNGTYILRKNNATNTSFSIIEDCNTILFRTLELKYFLSIM